MDQATPCPIAAESELYRRDEDTRRTALDVVKHAER
jgi:hypothetical protein